MANPNQSQKPDGGWNASRDETRNQLDEMQFAARYRRRSERITPSLALVADTLTQMQQRTQHPHRNRWSRIAIATAAVVAVGCGAPALAAQTQSGYAFLYAVSPSTAQFFVPIHETCIDQDIQMEVVSAAIHGDTAEVYLTIRDLTGTRFGESAPDLYDSYSLHYPARGQSCGCSLVDYDAATSTATFYLSITNMEQQPFTSGKYTFSLRELLVGQQTQKGITVDYALAEVPLSPPVQYRRPNGGSSSSADSTIFDEINRNNGYDFLIPQGTLWQSDDGIFRVIAAGYTDGQLHILQQVNQSLGYDNHAWLQLQPTVGDAIDPVYTVCYRDDETNETDGIDAMDASYQEFVYAVPYEDLSATKLVGDFYTTSDKIQGDWRVTFRLTEHAE